MQIETKYWVGFSVYFVAYSSSGIVIRQDRIKGVWIEACANRPTEILYSMDNEISPRRYREEEVFNSIEEVNKEYYRIKIEKTTKRAEDWNIKYRQAKSFIETYERRYGEND